MEIDIINQVILGMIQGITEWLPISSSGMVSLFASNILGMDNLKELVSLALFFHLGTFFAALIYFRKEVTNLFIGLFNYKKTSGERKNVLNFLIIATLISGILGIVLVKFISDFGDSVNITGKGITLIVGVLLIFTGAIQLRPIKRGLKKIPNFVDSIILGVSQGLAALPGISRSGITVSALLLRKFNDTNALKLSFLMSLPIVLFGNIILNFTDFGGGTIPIYGLLTSFVFGYLTIGALISISKRINFGWFCIGFGVLMGISILI